jgi:hypothetical protein
MRDTNVAPEMRSISRGKASRASPQPTNSKLHGRNFELELESLVSGYKLQITIEEAHAP